MKDIKWVVLIHVQNEKYAIDSSDTCARWKMDVCWYLEG